MAHPSNAIPSTVYSIGASETATLTGNDFFYAVTAVADSVVTVKGGGVFEYIDIDSASAAVVVKYINPSTGEPYVNEAAANGATAGFYETVPSLLGVAITLPAGATIYGRFTEIATSSLDEVVAYK